MSTRGLVAGTTMPRTEIERPRRMRRRERNIDRRGMRVIVSELDSSAARVASPGKRARIVPVRGRSTVVLQLPSTAQRAVLSGEGAPPLLFEYRISTGAPAAELPSAKRSTPL